MGARPVDDKASDTLVAGLRRRALDGEFDSPPSPPAIMKPRRRPRMAPRFSIFGPSSHRSELRQQLTEPPFEIADFRALPSAESTRDEDRIRRTHDAVDEFRYLDDAGTRERLA